MKSYRWISMTSDHSSPQLFVSLIYSA